MLKLLGEIGKGEHGLVHKAKLKCCRDALAGAGSRARAASIHAIIVAAKRRAAGLPFGVADEALLLEGLLLHALRHNGIVGLVASLHHHRIDGWRDF